MDNACRLRYLKQTRISIKKEIKRIPCTPEYARNVITNVHPLSH